MIYGRTLKITHVYWWIWCINDDRSLLSSAWKCFNFFLSVWNMSEIQILWRQLYLYLYTSIYVPNACCLFGNWKRCLHSVWTIRTLKSINKQQKAPSVKDHLSHLEHKLKFKTREIRLVRLAATTQPILKCFQTGMAVFFYGAIVVFDGFFFGGASEQFFVVVATLVQLW